MKPSIKCKTATLPLLVAFALPFVVSLAPKASAQAPPGALWYNGDLNGSGEDSIGLWNQIAFGSLEMCRPTPSQIYDDFTVPSPFGWIVNEVFSDNIVTTSGGTPIIG